MLQALVERYEAVRPKGQVPMYGWERRDVSFALRLSKEGELLQVLPLIQKKLLGKKEVDRPREIIVPMGETRASGVFPFFLCDNSSYLLGADKKGKPQRTAECFAAARKSWELLRRMQQKLFWHFSGTGRAVKRRCAGIRLLRLMLMKSWRV